MISTLPSVQFNCKHVYVSISRKEKRENKRFANRRHRRVLNRITRSFINDPEKFENEGFNAPSLSDWDID